MTVAVIFGSETAGEVAVAACAASVSDDVEAATIVAAGAAVDIGVAVGVAVTTIVWMMTAGVGIGAAVFSAAGADVEIAGSEPHAVMRNETSRATPISTDLVVVTRVIVVIVP